MMINHAVAGFCPACGQTSLAATGDSRVMALAIKCQNPDCPRPDAVHEILQDSQTEHEVTFTADGFTLRHPVRERLDDELLHCQAHRYLMDQDGPVMAPGTYRMTLVGEAGHERCYGFEPMGGVDHDVYPGS